MTTNHQICRDNGHSFEIETHGDGAPNVVGCVCCGDGPDAQELNELRALDPRLMSVQEWLIRKDKEQA